MTSLKIYERDLELSTRLGDRRLRLPDTERLLDLVREHLGSSHSSAATLAELTFARWKPGVAAVGTWLVRFENGGEQYVTYKVYAGDKSQHVAEFFSPDEHAIAAAAPLAPFALLDGDSAFLTTFPADRVLRGAGRAMDLRRTGRSLDRTQLWHPRVFRRRSSSIALLRYKPERRAVLRLDAQLKLRQGAAPTMEAGSRTLAVRVVDPAEVGRIVSARIACGCQNLVQLLHTDSAAGLLFEEWIVGESVASEDFHFARESGEALADLHRESMDGAMLEHNPGAHMPIFERVAGSGKWLEKIPSRPAMRATCWIHGDYHPDQHIRTECGLRLLDLDALRLGRREEDIASWIADYLAVNEDSSLRAAAEPLLEGYGPDRTVLQPELLARLVADELRLRAAAGLRRMQMNAEQRALRLLERAVRVLSEELPS